VTIGSNISAGGDVEISDVHVHITHNGADLHGRAERVCVTIANSIKERRFGVIIFDADKADPKELAAFRTVLWDDRLENIVSNGLCNGIYRQR